MARHLYDGDIKLTRITTLAIYNKLARAIYTTDEGIRYSVQYIIKQNKYVDSRGVVLTTHKKEAKDEDKPV